MIAATLIALGAIFLAFAISGAYGRHRARKAIRRLMAEPWYCPAGHAVRPGAEPDHTYCPKCQKVGFVYPAKGERG